MSQNELTMRVIAILVSVLFSSSLISQEKAGLVLGQYNGLNALSLNPSFAFNSSNAWDLQLGGAHAFANTNYAHITNASLLKLIRNGSEVFIPESSNDIVPADSDMVMTFNQNGATHAEVKGDILGPGLMIPIGEKIKVGVSTKARALASGYGIPAVFNYDSARNLTLDSIYTMPSAGGGAMAWAELNLHYAQKLENNISIGASLKLLKSYGSAFAQNTMDFDFQAFEDDEIAILTNGTFKIAYPADENSLSASGYGLGIDIGMTFKEVMGSNVQLGVSIIDLGYVNNNGYLEEYSFDTSLNLDEELYRNIETLEELRSQLEQDMVTTSRVERYYMQLPTALAVQYSAAIAQHFSVEGYWVQRIVYAPNSVSTYRPNSLNISAVYDRKHFSAMLPITLTNYSDMRVGAAFRLGFLTIGSDKVLSLFGSRDFTGTDIYANVQVYPFKLWDKKNKGGKVQCYF